jgi:antirestriction protein
MEAKIYVGTYGKYNAGNLYGKWLDLTEYSDKEEFYEACKALHKDEHDPEYMFQDYEGILQDMPNCWISESSLSETVFDILDYFSDNEDKAEAFIDWVKSTGYQGDFHYLLSNFDEAYIGAYDNEKAYGEELVDELGILDKMGDLSPYFDYEAYTRDLFLSDYMYLNGIVYRNV